MRKRVCVLQVTPESPNSVHVEHFKEKVDCDFYFVTHDAPHCDALSFCPDTKWSETRNMLVKEVPKNYDYYAFVDYDYIFRPQGELGVLEQILEDLNEFEPAILTYYPGRGIHTPLSGDESFRQSKQYSVVPFAGAGFKIVHHSLLDWFFPMVTKFDGDFASCHLFNILEIPLYRHVVTSHKMIYDNGESNKTSPHNKDAVLSHQGMQKMWAWILPGFKRSQIIDFYASTAQEKYDPLIVKKAFIDILKNRDVSPERSQKDVNYFDKKKLGLAFDFRHEYFLEKGLKADDLETNKEAQDVAKTITRKQLLTKNNPWVSFSNQHNLAQQDLVNEFHKIKDNPSFFVNSGERNEEFMKLISNKRVAYVGPAPYLVGTKNGKKIDDYDVVVRIQSPSESLREDYGIKTDVIQSCLNFNYGPVLEKYLDSIEKEKRPKFIICNDTVVGEIAGRWKSVMEEYKDRFSRFDIPLCSLYNSDGTHDRWHLYWEIYPKCHTEVFEDGAVTFNSSNFNSGYGCIPMLLRYTPKELYITGIDFYNLGIPQTIEQKYHSEHIRKFGSEGTQYGPDKMLHDQLSQFKHFRDVILSNCKNVVIDEHLRSKLYSKKTENRLKLFNNITKFNNTTT